MALHKALGKVFAALKLRAQARRTNHAHALQVGAALEVVGYAGHQRVFVAHHQHVHLVVEHSLGHGLEVERLYVEVLAILVGAGVAGSYEKMVEQLALAQLPGYGAFAAARAKQQYVHFLVSHLCWCCYLYCCY